MIPRFLYTPKGSATDNTRFIYDPDNAVLWQVVEFDSLKKRTEWMRKFQSNEIQIDPIAINYHRQYPFALFCIGNKGISEIKQLIALGNEASDWYVQFHLRNKDLSKPKHPKHARANNTPKEYYKHWVYGDNLLSNPDWMYLINLEWGLMVKFNKADAYFASFEAFENEIADIQFLNGHRPDDNIIEQLTIDAWNFLHLAEKADEDYIAKNFGNDY